MLVVICLLLSKVNTALLERECAPGAFYNFKRRATPRYLPTSLERTVLDLSFPCPSVCGGSYDVSQSMSTPATAASASPGTTC